MGKQKYQRFGKYLILDHLVDGGMAKICRASYLGEQANKIVAIKMVQPQYSKNTSFVQMFEDELKVTFSLLHPNIVQVYDYGLVNEQLYSAMEYVDGANLKQFLDRLKQMKYVFPVEISTYIVSQVSIALQYAHTFQDKLTGKPFNIIHRDISPHNIMLTYDGAVKVIDFGIAKADSNTETTQAGTIKGKLSYLAPEYLEGLELDHRYDQFAVGITLWEMLCSRKLFTAKNDLAVLKQIQACKVPKPSSINPNVPAELDEIVLKALSKDRNQRYENMDKLNRALIKFLYSNYPEFNATDLTYFAHQLFKKEIDENKKKYVAFGKIDLKPYIKEMESNNNSSSKTEKSKDDKADLTGSFISKEERTGKIELDLGSFDNTKSSSVPTLALDLAKSSSNIGKTKVSTKKNHLEKGTTTADNAKPADKTRNTTSNYGVTRTRISSRRYKNKQQPPTKKGGGGILPLIIIAASFAIGLFNPELVKKHLGIDLSEMMGVERKVASSDNKKKVEIDRHLKELKKTGKVGYIVFNAYETDMIVLINGVEKKFDGIELEVKLNEKLNIIVTKTGYERWSVDPPVFLTKSSPSVAIDIPKLNKESIGYVTTSQNYSSGSEIKFNIGSEAIVRRLPLKNERVPTGTYDAIISNSLLGTERKIRFTVEENKRNFIR
jgi:eukaryotic-like serine/threonine-protein kinase